MYLVNGKTKNMLLIDRIGCWLLVEPQVNRLLLHPDDKKEWATLRKTEGYRKIAGHLPVKFLGEEGELPA